MKVVERVEVSGHYEVGSGLLIETTTHFYTDGTSEIVEIRWINTHAPGWESNADN